MENFIKMQQNLTEKEHKIREQVLNELLAITQGYLGKDWASIMFNPGNKCFYDEINMILNKYGFRREEFYLRVLNALSINDYLLPSDLSGAMYILSAERKDGKIKLQTIDGAYEAIQLSEYLNNQYLLENKNVMSNNCYYFSQVISVQEHFDICTSVFNGLYTEKYIHAYNINEEGLYCDGSRNLAMSEETFETLYRPDFQIYRMSYDEFLNDPLYHIDVENRELSASLIAKRELQKRF